MIEFSRARWCYDDGAVTKDEPPAQCVSTGQRFAPSSQNYRRTSWSGWAAAYFMGKSQNRENLRLCFRCAVCSPRTSTLGAFALGPRRLVLAQAASVRDAQATPLGLQTQKALSCERLQRQQRPRCH